MQNLKIAKKQRTPTANDAALNKKLRTRDKEKEIERIMRKTYKLTQTSQCGGSIASKTTRKGTTNCNTVSKSRAE
jgi:hypothetical protein